MTTETIAETEVETTDTSLILRRTFDAPRERVWRAFTDSDELEQWFVPGGMTAEVTANEVEPGGAMSIHWTDGEHRIENDGYYIEVVEHERLVTGEEIDEGELHVTYEFRDIDDGTEIVITQEFPDAVPDGAAEGWASMLDGLQEMLAEQPSRTEADEGSLRITRTFDASRERVFRAFTDPDEFEEWFAPGSLTPEVTALEPEPDGEFAVSFVGDEDRTDIGGTYVEVVEDERIVHTWDYPGEGESRLTIEFRDADGGCEVVLTHDRIGPYQEHSAEENADLYEGGWSSALDKLENFL